MLRWLKYKNQLTNPNPNRNRQKTKKLEDNNQQTSHNIEQFNPESKLVSFVANKSITINKQQTFLKTTDKPTTSQVASLAANRSSGSTVNLVKCYEESSAANLGVRWL